MEEPPCDLYLKSKRRFPDDQVHDIVSKLLRADPDPNGANCEWIINAYLNQEFILDEDEERVKDDILKFKELFGDRRPLPKKGYKEIKVMIRERSEKETKKTIAKSKINKSKTLANFNDCKSFFKNIKNTLPEPYNSYSKEESDVLFEEIQNANPTDNFKNCIWIVEELKKGNIKAQDLTQVRNYLEKYFKKLHQLPLPNFYPNFPVTSNYQLVKDAVEGNVELLYAADNGILLIPKNKEASCHYGMQTSWCTAQRNTKNMYDNYSKKGDLYIWFDKVLKDKFQFHFEQAQFMDKYDNPISKEVFNKFRNHPVLGMIFKEKMDIKLIKKYMPFLSHRWTEAESYIMDPEESYLYAKDVIKGRWPQDEEIGRQAEQIIIKDPKSAYEYAKNIIKGRWLEAEPYILKNQDLIYDYAKDVIKGRWPQDEDIGRLAEERILQLNNSILIELYLENLIKGRWIEAESKFFSKYPNYAYQYALNNLKGRWPQDEIGQKAEQTIINVPLASYLYAMNILKGRWPKEKRNEAENIILTSPEITYKYARDVIKRRWDKAENVIINQKDPKLILDYYNDVLQKRWPKETREEAENILLNNKYYANSDYVKKYIQNPDYRSADTSTLNSRSRSRSGSK
jgi:hypothetical protein